jgi:hypothetical protein
VKGTSNRRVERGVATRSARRIGRRALDEAKTIPQAFVQGDSRPKRPLAAGGVCAILMVRRTKSVVLAAVALAPLACATMPTPGAPVDTTGRGGVTFIRAKCVEVRSCLLGQVVAAESSAPMPRAAIFLEREADDSIDSDPVRILTLTDDQGVFTVVDAPEGRYRLAIYKDARRLEARGLELGAPGTMLVPVRLPSS